MQTLKAAGKQPPSTLAIEKMHDSVDECMKGNGERVIRYSIKKNMKIFNDYA